VLERTVRWFMETPPAARHDRRRGRRALTDPWGLLGVIAGR
jgi:hypothetical protein